MDLELLQEELNKIKYTTQTGQRFEVLQTEYQVNYEAPKKEPSRNLGDVEWCVSWSYEWQPK